MKKSRFFGSVLFWILTICVAVIIFMFSCENGEESKEVSESLLSVIIEKIGNIVSHNVLRKIAHFSEFAALGFCVSGAIHFTFNKNNFFLSLIPCFLYAISDEVHQYFVPERACRVFDIFVDTCGSSVGILIFLFVFMLTGKIKRSR